MVEDLINADADINAADNSGKTALHWAAAVNNIDAVNVLLAHGANRDAQDDKVRVLNQYCTIDCSELVDPSLYCHLSRYYVGTIMWISLLSAPPYFTTVARVESFG